MATLQYSGIDALLTKNLLQVGDNVNDIKYISITNTSNNNVFVSLFLNKGDNNYYLLYKKKITIGSTLTLNKDNNISFDNTTNGFSLRAKLEAGTVDVIITR
tara:strand:+ start:1089 stop:1394 length:306 start_codon:yes stop_codon:yes gene_type:complete